MMEAERAARETDCMLVIGTTGEVFPAASLPVTAARNGAPIIEINPRPSAYTGSVTTVYLPLTAAEALDKLAKIVARDSLHLSSN